MPFFRKWARRRTLERRAIPDPLWQSVTGRMPFLSGMSADEAQRLRELATLFLAEKELHGAAGFELTDEMRVAIAAQACLPILNLGLDCYGGWVGVVVYPGEFRVRREEMDESGVMHEWLDELSGEAFPGGPVVLSWEDIDLHDSGYNVVIHEFAHKLDALSGDADGMPPAPAGIPESDWRECLKRHYEDFCAWADSHETLLFDEYAAEHPAEFFAVMSEAFFTEPQQLNGVYPELYDALQAFYRQDPLARLENEPT
jgi:hypothetical protein